MKLEKFLDEFPRIETSSVAPNGASWSEWYAKAEETEGIDFGCNFDSNNCCNTDRIFFPHKGCCGSCAHNKGYLKLIPVNAAEAIAKLFQARNGFWRKDKGCILPRKYRSALCLTTACQKLIGAEEKQKIESLTFWFDWHKKHLEKAQKEH